MIRKTQLVTEFVFRYRKAKDNRSVLWVSAAGLDPLVSDLTVISNKMKRLAENGLDPPLRPQSDDPACPKENLYGPEYVKAWMANADNWLLVLDNLDDVALNVHKFLPERASGAVIITSRDSRVVGSIANSGMELQQMSFEEGVRLFLNLQRKDSASEMEDPACHPEYPTVENIVQELHGFPLAIDQAAAFIRENSLLTLSEYLELLKPRTEDRELLLRFKEANPTYPESIMTTWEISFKYLERNHPRASLLLQILGFFHHSRISEALLNSATKKRQWEFASIRPSAALDSRTLPEISCLAHNAGFRLAVGVLCALSLVKRATDMDGPLLSVHPLVHEWIKVRLNTNNELQSRLCVSAAQTIYQTFPFELIVDNFGGFRPATSKSSLSRFDLVLPHATCITRNLQELSCAGSISLDCVVLLIAMSVVMTDDFNASRFPISDRGLKRFLNLLHLSMKQTSTDQQLQLSIMWVILKWKQSHGEGLWLSAAKHIQGILETAQIELKSTTSSAMALLILTQLIVDFCGAAPTTAGYGEPIASSLLTSLLRNKIPDMSDHRLGYNDLDSILADCTSIVPEILNRFRAIAKFDSWDPSFNQAAHLYIEMRCANLLSSQQYWSQPEKCLLDDPLLVDLKHLGPEDRSFFISICCKLQWERKPLRDISGIRQSYELALYEARSSARKLVKHRLIAAGAPMSSYLSSSFGRTISEFDVPTDRSVMNGTLPSYVRGTFFDVVKALSDPSDSWLDRLAGPRRLALHERRYSVGLLKLLRDYYVTLDSCNLLYVEKSDHREVQMTLIYVFRNLGDWDNIDSILKGLLQSDCVLAWYAGPGRDFWDFGILERARGRTEIRQSGAVLTATSPAKSLADRFEDDALALHTSGDMSGNATGTYFFSRIFRSVSAVKSNLPWFKSPAPLREQDDPWMTGITLHVRRLSTGLALNGYLKQNTHQGGGGSEENHVKDRILRSDGFATYILAKHEMAHISKCLLSDRTDDDLLTVILCFKMAGRLSGQRYEELKHRVEFSQSQSSILAKGLGRLALIIDLGSLYPSASSIPIPNSDAYSQPMRYVKSIN